MANNVDSDQTAPLGAVWPESALFAETCVFILYFILLKPVSPNIKTDYGRYKDASTCKLLSQKGNYSFFETSLLMLILVLTGMTIWYHVHATVTLSDMRLMVNYRNNFKYWDR